MKAKTLMVVGSMSSVGKSLLVTALCRIYARRGVKVAPFKAQNMSNNAAICPDGSEIGRAQALQALAAGIEPTAAINPVLLKPEADARSQIIVMGKVWATLPARTYYERKVYLWGEITTALNHLCNQYDLVIIEGAGSPAELNLKQGDLVNMSVAKYIHAPVVIAGDIDRGGIFAQLLGTLWLLDEDERALVRGLIVNKFRGDPTLFKDGIRILEERAHRPVIGVVPYFKNLFLPEEDAAVIEQTASARRAPDSLLDIVVISLPRLSNFDDFDPLQFEQGVRVRFVDSVEKLGNPAAIILPGTKSTIADLMWLKSSGLAQKIVDFAQRGGSVAGICGGYQMLGRSIHDPFQTESSIPYHEGLGLLPVETRFSSQKATFQVKAIVQGESGWLGRLKGLTVEGYEIHMGQTISPAEWLRIYQRNNNEVSIGDGCCSSDGKIWGCYLHGIFNNDPFRRAWLQTLGWQSDEALEQAALLENSLNRLADQVEAALDMNLLEHIIWGSTAEV